jgi:hypothetical protein
MPAGTAPEPGAVADRVTVTWSAATFPNGTSVAGYVIHRYNAATGLTTTVGGDCGGVVAVTTCSESVPPGTWAYTDTPVQLTWTGAESPPSHPVTVALT